MKHRDYDHLDTDLPLPPHPMDLRPFLPRDWIEQVQNAAQGARHVVTQGGGPGSLGTDPSNTGLDYHTLQGDEAVRLLPWAAHLHAVTIPALLRIAGNEPTLRPIIASHGISLNLLSPESALDGLEWHLDGVDVERTVVLANRDWDAASGGRFLTHDGQSVQYHELTAGIALSCATGLTPHAVEPPIASFRTTLMFAYSGPHSRPRAMDQDAYIGVDTGHNRDRQPVLATPNGTQ